MKLSSQSNQLAGNQRIRRSYRERVPSLLRLIMVGALFMGVGWSANALPMFNTSSKKHSAAKLERNVQVSVPIPKKQDAPLGRVVLTSGLSLPPHVRFTPNLALEGTDIVFEVGNETDNATLTQSLRGGPTGYEGNLDLGYGLHLNVIGAANIIGGPATPPRVTLTGPSPGGGNFSLVYYPNPNPVTGTPAGFGGTLTQSVGSNQGTPFQLQVRVGSGQGIYIGIQGPIP